MSDVLVKFERVASLEETNNVKSDEARSLFSATGRDDILVLELADHTLYGLNKSDPRFSLWREVLESRRDFGGYVYVEAESAGVVSEVKEVFTPSEAVVQAVVRGRGDGRIALMLPPSPSLRYLNPAHPDFDNLLRQINEAQRSGEKILVTVNPHTREVVHVRKVPSDEARSGADDLPAKFDVREKFSFDLSPFAVTAEVADATFEFLRTRPFIPFDYLGDCCASRAHEMCDMLRRRGIRSVKVWNYASGYINCTKPDPQDCQNTDTLIGSHEDTPGVTAKWLYHVAPVISVIRPDGSRQLSVIDPATFRRRRTVRQWVNHMRDERAEQAFSAPEVHFLFPNGQPLFDPDFKITCHELYKHRNDRELIRLLPS